MTFRELWESPPAFSLLDKLKVGDSEFEMVGIETDHEGRGEDGVVTLRPIEGTPFIPDSEDEDSRADYYRVPLSILKAAKPLVAKYQAPQYS